MHKRATQKDKEEKISNVFYEERLIPIPVNHRLSKTASLWKIDRRGWDETLNSEWTIKPHDYSPHRRAREKLSTDELYELIFLQPREPTEREKQQMVVRMESELAEFMRKPHESTFPDDTHDKCQKTLSQVLEFLEHKYNTVYSQLGRDMNDKRNKKLKAKPKLSSSFKIGKKRCPPGCVKKKASRKTSRKRRSVKRKTSRKRRSVKRSRKKAIGGKMRTIHKSKNPIPYDEDWAEGFVTHVGPGGGGGRNNYTGAKKVPTRRILDARKKLIDKIYLLHDQLVALDSSLVKNMFTGVVSNPTEWRDPPQYMDRDVLKYYVEMMKADVKSEKQKLKKSHKFSAGKRTKRKYKKRTKRNSRRNRKAPKLKRYGKLTSQEYRNYGRKLRRAAKSGVTLDGVKFDKSKILRHLNFVVSPTKTDREVLAQVDISRLAKFMGEDDYSLAHTKIYPKYSTDLLAWLLDGVHFSSHLPGDKSISYHRNPTSYLKYLLETPRSKVITPKLEYTSGIFNIIDGRHRLGFYHFFNIDGLVLVNKEGRRKIKNLGGKKFTSFERLPGGNNARSNIKELPKDVSKIINSRIMDIAKEAVKSHKDPLKFIPPQIKGRGELTQYKKAVKYLQKKHKFSAGNKIPATHEADKELSKAEIWKKASLECFAEKEKAKRKVAKLEKELRKCSRNLRLSQELPKANEKKSRKHKFRNGDGKENPETFTECWNKHVGPGNVVTAAKDAALRTCVWKANALRYAQQQAVNPLGLHYPGDPFGKGRSRR